MNGNLLSLTPTDQPIYIRNDSFQGWLRDPQNLTVGDLLFDPTSMSWIEVTSTRVVAADTTVFDVVTNGFNDFVANGVLLDMK